MAFTVAAPAKVNLFLHVLGRRPDGYHDLDSLAVLCGAADQLSADTAPELRLTVTGPFADSLIHETNNLVLRAARFLAARCNVPAAAHLKLEKNLPVTAGIGGGSADAAAALLACASLWDVNLAAISHTEIAAALGADVPVCLAGRMTGAARMGGIGDIISPVPTLPPAWLVLVNPGKALSTPQVFGALAGRFGARAPALPTCNDAQDLAQWLRAQRNDLAAPACEIMPEITGILSALMKSPCLLARMSGSGPTCFGLYGDDRTAKAAAAALIQANPAWWVKAAPLLRPA